MSRIKSAKYEYIGSDNERFLSSILFREFLNIGVPIEEMTRIARGRGLGEDKIEYPLEHIRAMIGACKRTIDEYISDMGGISKGELTTVGSMILDVPTWKFNSNILERHTTRIEGTVLKDELSKMNIFSRLTADFIPATRDLKYKVFTRTNQIVWYKDMNKASTYVNDMLTIPKNPVLVKIIKHEKPIKQETKFKEVPTVKHEKESKDESTFNKYLRTNYLPIFTHRIEVPSPEPVSINSADEFVVRYNINKDSFVKLSPILDIEIERTLSSTGSYEKADITTLRRIIIRNARFADIFKIPGTKYFNASKVRRLADFYSSAESFEREQFWTDAEKVFGVKQI